MVKGISTYKYFSFVYVEGMQFYEENILFFCDFPELFFSFYLY